MNIENFETVVHAWQMVPSFTRPPLHEMPAWMEAQAERERVRSAWVVALAQYAARKWRETPDRG